MLNEQYRFIQGLYETAKTSPLRYVVRLMAVVVCVGSTSQGSEQPWAVPTFHCAGLYWNAERESADNVCRVRYRKGGSQKWKEALPMWFDGSEYRIRLGWADGQCHKQK